MVWEKPGVTRDVYLTFDDGPHPEVTSFVLEELRRYGNRATFFLVGDNVRKYPSMIQELEKYGHVTGNHTMHHLKGWNTDDASYAKDIQRCADYVQSSLFRPPYGRIRMSQVRMLKPKYQIIMWSLLALDYRTGLDKKKALNSLMRKTRNGSIVVFHDSLKAESNLRYILPPYLEFLHQKGYSCKTL